MRLNSGNPVPPTFFANDDIVQLINFINHLILLTNKMSFSELPSELLSEIVSYVVELGHGPRIFPTRASTDSLLALSLNCKAVSAIAEAQLHERFFFYSEYGEFWKPSERLYQYTRTIYERPDLAAKVTHLQFDIQHVNGWRKLNDMVSDVEYEDSDSGEEEIRGQGTLQEEEEGVERLVGNSPAPSAGHSHDEAEPDQVNLAEDGDMEMESQGDESSEDDTVCRVPGCGCGNLSAGQIEVAKLERAQFRSLCDTEVWYECANLWGSELELDVVEGPKGLQDRESAALLLSKLPSVEHLMMEWTENMLVLIIELTKIVLDPEYDLFRAQGPLHQGIPVPNCLHRLRILDLDRDDEMVDDYRTSFELAEITPLLLLPSLDDLRLRNCLDNDSSDPSFDLQPGSSNISRLSVIKSMIGTRNWNVLIAGCQRFKTVRYSARTYPNRFDPEHEIADTISLTAHFFSSAPYFVSQDSRVELWCPGSQII